MLWFRVWKVLLLKQVFCMKIRFHEFSCVESHIESINTNICFVENNKDGVNVAAIACGTVAGILLLVIIGLLVIFERKFYPVWKGTLINCYNTVDQVFKKIQECIKLKIMYEGNNNKNIT